MAMANITILPCCQTFTLYFVLTFILKNTCPNPSSHLFEQNMGNCLLQRMRLRDRMLGITFQWNRGAGGFTTPKHAKQHGKHGLNFSFSLSVFCDNFGEDSGPNNHIISPNPYWLDGALGKDRDYVGGTVVSRLDSWVVIGFTPLFPFRSGFFPPQRSFSWSTLRTMITKLRSILKKRGTNHFLKLECVKITCHYSEKNIYKSNFIKYVFYITFKNPNITKI